jgi:pyruvate kinase
MPRRSRLEKQPTDLQQKACYFGDRTLPTMILPNHKTKIVATIGPASNSPEILERLIRAGMNIARLNFSHGSFDQHAEVIARIRAACKATGRRGAD